MSEVVWCGLMDCSIDLVGHVRRCCCHNRHYVGVDCGALCDFILCRCGEIGAVKTPSR